MLFNTESVVIGLFDGLLMIFTLCKIIENQEGLLDVDIVGFYVIFTYGI